MGIMNVPKAMYKAQQAKKQMSKIQVAGTSGSVSILMNGLNEIVEIEIDEEGLTDSDTISRDEFEKILKKLKDQFKNAMSDAKEQLEKEMMNSANLDDIKEMLGL
ncbi:YbaB/EbfC family nucleoid-associated protein [Candidatus Dojkabacteria bacterium]|uniref:YbaB/EbfC family nucleoid-associated protein n=1 Tax=Candidatus Dojkabacteria bacterium TaxID=2099670 RepID=A0A955L946_9BACT|nr:YbaB/EbfC family nucleoid-associated protein [Candidatus Dojkabacteria bacterium]